jgi:hypothetical protein
MVAAFMANLSHTRNTLSEQNLTIDLLQRQTIFQLNICMKTFQLVVMGLNQIILSLFSTVHHLHSQLQKVLLPLSPFSLAPSLFLPLSLSFSVSLFFLPWSNHDTAVMLYNGKCTTLIENRNKQKENDRKDSCL